jgi:hypothetical protein
MRPLYRGLIVCAVHLLLVASLGGKLLYDRSTRPRVWARTTPYDPSLAIRGRYVSLQLEVHPVDIAPPPLQREPEDANDRQWWRRYPAVLSSEGGQLVARADANIPESESWRADNVVMFRRPRNGVPVVVLAEPVLYFIPEHIPDPSRRAADEELWVEVTLPRKGPPRPIRLGVKKDGALNPLDIN